MGIDFNRTFGAGSTQTNTNQASGAGSQGGQGASNRPVCKLWANIGYVAEGAGENGEDRFVSLPVGLPVETMEPVSTNSRNEGYAEFQAARNDLLAQLLAAGNDLAPGEDRIVNLQIQLRRINEERPAPSTSENRFARQLDL